MKRWQRVCSYAIGSRALGESERIQTCRVTGTQPSHDMVGMMILSHFRFRRTGYHVAPAFQPVIAILTELLQSKIVKEECPGDPGTTVTILDRF